MSRMFYLLLERNFANLLKVHVDVKERLKVDWNAMLADTEFVGEAVIETKWPRGYSKMTVVEATRLRR